MSVWLNAPPSAVTVWATLSLFVQVTLVPAFTIRLCGLKAKFVMETLFPPLVGAVVAVGVGAVVEVAVGAVVGAAVGVEVLAVDEAPPHAATRNMRPIIHTPSHCFGLLVVTDFCIPFLLLRFSIVSRTLSGPSQNPT